MTANQNAFLRRHYAAHKILCPRANYRAHASFSVRMLRALYRRSEILALRKEIGDGTARE